MAEISTLNLIISGLVVLGTYTLFAWGLWLGYKGMTADAPPFKAGGHAIGGPGTYDDRCVIGGSKGADVRRMQAAAHELELAA